jgi:hypothetical protein
VSPHFARSHFFARQESRERSFQNVGAATDGVCGVTVVGALAVETQVVGRRHEERLQQLAVCQRVQLGGHVQNATGDGHRAPETQQPAKHS